MVEAQRSRTQAMPTAPEQCFLVLDMPL